jgi:hypothetical protein
MVYPRICRMDGLELLNTRIPGRRGMSVRAYFSPSIFTTAIQCIELHLSIELLSIDFSSPRLPPRLPRPPPRHLLLPGCQCVRSHWIDGMICI